LFFHSYLINYKKFLIYLFSNRCRARFPNFNLSKMIKLNDFTGGKGAASDADFIKIHITARLVGAARAARSEEANQ